MLTIKTATAAIEREISEALALLGRAETGWGQPTRLPGWSIGDLAAHLAMGQSLQADAWRRLSAGDTDPARAETAPSAADREAALDAIESTAQAFRAQLDRADEDSLAAMATMPYGAVPGTLLLHLAVMEAGVHRSDLAAAVGEDDRLEADVVDASLLVLRAFLPALAAMGASAENGTSIRLESPEQGLSLHRTDAGWEANDEPAGTVVRGPGSELVLLALGRRVASDANIETTGDTSLVTKFKDLFPGP